MVLGRYPDLPLKTVQAERDKLAIRVATGENPAKEKKLAQAGLTTNPTARGEKYYQKQAVKNLDNPRGFRRYLDSELFSTPGDKALKDLNALDVQALVHHKRDNGRVASAMRIRMTIFLTAKMKILKDQARAGCRPPSY